MQSSRPQAPALDSASISTDSTGIEEGAEVPAGNRSAKPDQTRARAGLACRNFDEARPNLRSLPGVPLLSVSHGGEAELERDHATGALHAVLPTPPLGAGNQSEVWSLHSPVDRPVRTSVRAVERGPVQGIRAGETLAGAALFDADPLGQSVTAAYHGLLDLLDEENLHLLRVWNAVPRINQQVPENGQTLDRYMVFCRARSLALEECLGRDFPLHLSAASAVGATGRKGMLLFLAASNAGQRISNPRQEEAWRYPARYGPRAPSFARATRLDPSLGGGLLVSGTASIVGAESLHRDQPERQLDETLANLSALLRAANSGNSQRPLEDLCQVRVFLKDPTQLDLFKQRLMPQLAPGTPVHWVEADICRPELFIEIEAVAR